MSWPKFHLTTKDPKLAAPKEVKKFLKLTEHLLKRELKKNKLVTCFCGCYMMVSIKTKKQKCPHCSNPMSDL